MTRKYSLLIGRFEPVHIGHEKLIKLGLDKGTTVVVYVTKNKKDNIEVEKRIELIEKIYEKEIKEGTVIVRKYLNPEDRTTDYGKKVFNKFNEEIGQKPNILIYGSDKNLHNCFSEKDLENVEIIPVERDGINATSIRENIKKGNYEAIINSINKNIFHEVLKIKL